MQEVTIETDKLLAIVRNNRDKHKAIADEAREGYRVKYIERLQELIQEASTINLSKLHTLQVQLPQPQDHTEEYDKAIRMLELSVHAEVTLQAYEFDQLVLDEWSWKQGFTTSNSFYAASIQA